MMGLLRLQIREVPRVVHWREDTEKRVRVMIYTTALAILITVKVDLKGKLGSTQLRHPSRGASKISTITTREVGVGSDW